MANSDWTPHGSDAEYWRSDNPYLQFWYRFGDESITPSSLVLKVQDFETNATPPFNFERSYMSGVLVDSGPRQWHLMWGGGTARLSRLVTPVSGFAPWATAGSGMEYGGIDSNSWVLGAHNESAGWVWSELWNEAPAGGNLGHSPFAFGTTNIPSGTVIMGWFKVPEPDPSDPSPTFFDQIFGNFENSLAQGGTASAFSIGYRPTDLLPIIRYRLNGNASFVAVTGDASFPFAIDEPMFIAVQMHREEAIPEGWVNSVGGSGIARVWMGSHVSGLREVAASVFEDSDTRIQLQDEVLNQWQFGQDSNPVRSPGATDNHVPPGFALDEWVCVMDGRLSKQRIEYFMNSGIEHLTTADPTHPDFIPASPGTEGLVAYWTFDDQTGTNSAPATSGFTGMDMEFGTGVGDSAAVPGIRGGSGIRPFVEVRRETTISSATFDSEKIATGENSADFIFPDVNVSDQWTWIGWMDPQSTGSVRYGGVVGWYGGSAHHNWTAYGIGDWANGFSAGPGQDRQRGLEISTSGISESISNGTFTGATWGGGGLVGTKENTWQLWAFVFDFRHGLIYSVRDAKHIRWEEGRFSSVSGLAKDQILALTDFGWGFGNVEDTNTLTRAKFDDWAIYSRALSLPEMSGYALSGVAVSPIIAPVATSFKETLGYWPFNNDKVEVYDPTGLSGTRYSDQSWYRHHLTNVSGSVEISATDIASRVEGNSLQINTSGAMLSVERELTGANLDLASNLLFPASGFSAGIWAQLPSHGENEFFGLGGDHHLMGAWGTELANQAWQLGIRNNKPFLQLRMTTSPVDTLEASEDVPSGTPFFLAAVVKPSGSATTAEIYIHTGDFNEVDEFRLIGRSTSFSLNPPLNPGSESGFSLFNVPNRQQGFPSGSLFQAPFVFAGGFDNLTLAALARAGIDNIPLVSGGVSATDPANISHWKFDRVGSRFIDFGKEQNFVFPINQDGHIGGIIQSIHGSGVVIRETEYYDTLPFNANSRRLDLGSGSQSWTFLSWVLPPPVSNADRHYIMAKSDGLSGIQIFTPSDSLQLTTNASGVVGQGENGNLAPSQWNHIAVVFDRDNNQLTTIINGRYAGATFDPLLEVPVNNSGLALGGRGDQLLNSIPGGSAFSGYLDDTMLFSRALTLPEISGLAANSYNFNDGAAQITAGPVGGWMSGLPLFFVSGLIGSFMHGQAQDLELVAGYVSGVSGLCIPYGGFMHGRAFASGQIGSFLHGSNLASGTFGHFVHGLDIVSGFFGHYEFGACQSNGEFDIILNFSVVTNKDFDARLGVEKTQFLEFDARLGVVRITAPPGCTLEMPLIGEIVSGIPYTLTVQGSGIAQDDKKVAMTRFTFADFKNAESGILIQGFPNSGLFEASRELDTPGFYIIKLEVLDSFGYRSSCCRPFLLLPSGSTSGAFLNSLPGISIETAQQVGSAIHTVNFTHSISGLSTTSGLLEYTDFADQQESLVNGLEMPVGTQFIDFVRRHDYTMPGFYCPVWSVSGEFGIVSDTIADGIDHIS